MRVEVPLPPDHPIVKVLDGLIADGVMRARMAEFEMARRQADLAQVGSYRAQPTSYDTPPARPTDWYAPRGLVADIAQAAQDWLRADRQIGELQRLRLALFGDADFGSGQVVLHLLTQSRPFDDPPHARSETLK